MPYRIPPGAREALRGPAEATGDGRRASEEPAQAEQSAPAICPACGYCPTLRRALPPPLPPMPAPAPYVTWTTNGTAGQWVLGAEGRLRWQP